MLSPTPSPETVFQSEPDYLGVTGLWALPALPAEATDALLVLSSVSGSRALSTGALLLQCLQVQLRISCFCTTGIEFLARVHGV